MTLSYLSKDDKNPLCLLRFVFVFRYSKSDAVRFCPKPFRGRNLILNAF